MNETKKYSLETDVHLIINDAEIRLRKGIWNYEEGCITLEGCSQEFSRCLKETFIAMNGKGFSLVEVISSCPTNWGLTPQNALKWIEEKMIPYYPLGVYKDRSAAKEETK